MKGVEQDIGAWFINGKGIEQSLAGLGVEDADTTDALPKESIEAQEARASPLAPTVPHHDTKAVPGNEDVGLYVLGLQEVVDIASASEALRPYTDPSVANNWKTSVAAALPNSYRLVAEQQLLGLLLLIYASPEVQPHVKAVSTTSVGTGLMGYMGNKGAVTARIVLGETTRLVFVNSHLAAGADKTSLERRNWDASQITSRTRFDPITDAMGLNQGHGEGIGDEDFAFWFGDLNYRLEGMPGDDIRRLLTVHTKQHEQDTGNDSKESASVSGDSGYSSRKSEDAVPLPPDLDPASLQTTINCLLPHDELKQQQKLGKAFHDGWQEGPIRFLPTYKYDVGKVAVFDSSEKRRCPSWCDRILYRTRASRHEYNLRAKEREEARRKDEEMKAKGLDHAADDEDVLYDYDPENDGDKNDDYNEYDEYNEDQDPEPEIVPTRAGFSDEFVLETYTPHMRVISSDHKPLEAVFSLKYDAVIPELKTAIHQEVAKELDRQENEGRPSITMVVDRSAAANNPESKELSENSFEGADFGDVVFAKSKRRNLTIANTGRVPATFGFTNRPVDNDQREGAFPPWLSVKFDRDPDPPSKLPNEGLEQQYTLEPADVCNIELKLKIDSLDTVRNLNEETSHLDEVLVLRVRDGRDHFLPLRAHWQPSALSRTVDKLIKIPEGGIRKLQGQKPDHNGVRWSVPRELFRLTEAIEDMTERALAEWEMTGHEGDKYNAPWQHNAAWPFSSHDNERDEEAFAGIFDALDCDEPFDLAFPPGMLLRMKLEHLADALLLFLESLQDGIITKSLWERLEEGIATRERSKQLLAADDEKMWALEILATAPNHNASFLLIVSMLQNTTNQLAEATKPDVPGTRTSTDLPASPRASVRRRTLSKVPNIALRQLIHRNYATIFSDVLFRISNMDRLKEREKAVKKERTVRIVELFLKNESDGTA